LDGVQAGPSHGRNQEQVGELETQLCNAYEVLQMPGDPRDHKRSVENLATSENDPANLVFEEWIKLREDQGWTREAAYTELMIAREALLTARGSSASEDD
jgi:hypothetical protein